LIALLCVFALLALTDAVVVPLFEGPDEDDHFRYVKYLADHRALPVQLFQPGGGDAGHQGWQPPLYYGLAALVISPVDTSDYGRRLQRNPAAALTGDRACCGRNQYFHFDAEAFPYRRTALAVHLARAVTIAFGLLTVAAVYALVLTLLPGRRYLALATTALATLNPSFIYASALVSNDVPLVAFCTLALCGMAKLLTGAWQADWKGFALAGGLVAGGILVKTTALGLVPLAFLIALYVAWRRDDAREPSLSRLLRTAIDGRALVAFWVALAVPLFLLTGWYFVRNSLLYGDPLAYRLIAASALPPRDAPLTLPELMQINLPWLWQTFWGGPTPGDFPPSLLEALLFGLSVGLIGTGLYIVREWQALGVDRLAMLGVLAAWLTFIFAAQVQFIRTASGTDQGRYLFPALATPALVIALGWSEIVWRASQIARRGWSYLRAERGVALVATAFALALPVFVLFALTLPAYAQPAAFDPAQLEGRALPLNANFENGMQLRGVALAARAIACGDKLGVALYWTSTGRLQESYRIFAHLVNAQGTVAGNKDVIPGGGAYPTVYWKPNQWLEDTIRVPLNHGARAGVYHVIVGVYPFGAPDQRVNLQNSEDDFVTVGDVQVNAPAEGCP
jgi:4-amino-4-deoxy-L-arabinose transferase-like glycosyltransferase